MPKSSSGAIRLNSSIPVSCLAAFLLAACASDGGNVQHTSIGRVEGRGAPAILLQAGLGDDSSVWGKVAPELARDHLVVALDRPGHGSVAATDAARDPCTIATEQHRMLQEAGIAPPYLLVGHSIGGRYEFVYAKLFPQEVAGLVLLDATPPGHWQRVQAEAPAAAAVVKTLKTVAFGGIDKREFDDQDGCMASLDLAHPLTAPTTVLVPAQFRPEEQGAFRTMMENERENWLALTGAASLQVVPHSTHYLQKEAPDVVIAAVRSLVATVPAAVGNGRP